MREQAMLKAGGDIIFCMPDITTYKLLEACHQPGCPVCRLEQQSVEHYLDSQFYENVNSPKWRDWLNASLGFCHEHSWLAVNQRLGDALGFAIIYRGIIHATLDRFNDGAPPRSPRRWAALLRGFPEQARNLLEKMFYGLTPQKHCPACQHRDEITRHTLSVLVQALGTSEMIETLGVSEGLCFSHLRLALEQVREISACEQLMSIHRAKLESLEGELTEFIRKNDYRFKAEGFGKEGDAWLRAVGLIAGAPRQKG
jgi:uncharacterized protein DUF6062